MSDRKFSGSFKLGPRVLATAAAATATTLSLSGCDDRPQNNSATYANVGACAADHVYSQDFCEKSFAQAERAHEKSAPHYRTKEDCQEDWNDGGCDQYPDKGGVYYQPHMSGYWVGQNLYYPDGPADKNPTPSRRVPFSYPVYKTADGLYSPATDQSLGDTFSRSPTSERADFEAAHISEHAVRPVFGKGGSFAEGSIGRGGFGSTGHGFGSGE